ncbi:hypothetical protein GJR88_00231 [Dietzia sp. DQ12-45-1b]|nr:hypothetical protein GJR88_00231 [Dietzia sp. DQ12-45-1b]
MRIVALDAGASHRTPPSRSSLHRAAGTPSLPFGPSGTADAHAS